MKYTKYRRPMEKKTKKIWVGFDKDILKLSLIHESPRPFGG